MKISTNESKTSWQEVVKQLDLKPHPEGGFYRETYKSPINVPAHDGTTTRSASTAILFMITGENFSAFHRVAHDEIFHYYSGKSIEISMIHPDGRLQKVILGENFMAGEVPQMVVPAGSWQALTIKGSGSADDWSLVGATVAPGFHFDDFKMADRQELINEYPQHSESITTLTRSQ